MVKRDQPQWYGVQPKHDENFKQIGFYPINDTAVTDDSVRFQIKPRARLMAEPDQPARWPPEVTGATSTEHPAFKR